MSKNSDCGVVLGEGLVSARYAWCDRGWLVTYTCDGDTIATSDAPRHPSLRRLGRDVADEERVIELAFAVIDRIEDGVAQFAAGVSAGASAAEQEEAAGSLWRSNGTDP